MKAPSNLPPGVTNAAIERQAGVTKRTRAGDLQRKAEKAGWSCTMWWDAGQTRPRAFARYGSPYGVASWNGRRWAIIGRDGFALRLPSGRTRLFGSWVAAALMADRILDSQIPSR